MDGDGWNNFSPYYLVHKILERIVAQKIGDIYIYIPCTIAQNVIDGMYAYSCSTAILSD